MQLTRCIHRLASTMGARAATSCNGRSQTWSEFSDRVARLADGLRRLGVSPEDRVAILSLNSDYYLESFFGVLWAGGCLVPLNTRWAIPENQYALDDSGTTVLIVDDNFASTALELQGQCRGIRHIISTGTAPIPDRWTAYDQMVAAATPCADANRGGEDLAGIFYTGGTTGVAKGVMVPHRGLLSSAISTLAPAGYNDESVVLHIAPMFHMADVSQSVASTQVGSLQVMQDSFQPKRVLEAIERHRVTHLPLVPTMLKALVEHPEWNRHDLSSLQRICYGGSSITESLLKTAMERLGHCEFVQFYGQTELSPIATVLESKYHALTGPYSGHLQSAGRPSIANEVVVIDPQGQPVAHDVVGEITVSGPVTMLGYWNKPEETKHALVDGWIHTGDAGFLDENGFLHIVDRMKDIIISGGENIYSAEVENALAKHPSILGCVVIGVPDEQWGESVCAIVLLRDGLQATAEELIAHCRGLIAHYKCPRTVRFRSEPFPVSGAGKLLKRVLREEYGRL